MTAPAAAAVSGPIAPAAPRVAPQPPADRFAFAAVLDSLPTAPAKGGASTAEEQAHPSNESSQEESSRGQNAHHSPLNDSALLASLPFALRAAAMMNERPQAADNSPSLTAPAMKGPKSEDSGASLAAAAKTPAVGRLIGERAFHFGSSTFTSAVASRTLGFSAPLGSAAATPVANATAPAPTAPRVGASPSNRASLTRAATHEAARSGRKPEVSAPPPATRVETSAAVRAPAESSGKAADDRSSDPITSAAPSAPQADLFGGQLSASFAAGTTFQLDSSTPRAGQTDVAPRTTAAAGGAATSTPPIKEIDVDFSPGGLEDVSMTMRLAGDKLSVVIRAASSHTLNSIEGARDAIADRMAAIGQPLDSLIVKQAGVNTDGNANGNGSSADCGSAGGEQRSAQDAGERGGSNDADSSRRGAGRDRSF